MFARIVKWLSGPDLSHLWRCPLTGAYHDPRVLQRSLCALDPFTVDGIRSALGATPVSRWGTGHPEEHVEKAYLAFQEWLEGKGMTERSSPTSAPSMESPAA